MSRLLTPSTLLVPDTTLPACNERHSSVTAKDHSDQRAHVIGIPCASLAGIAQQFLLASVSSPSPSSSIVVRRGDAGTRFNTPRQPFNRFPLLVAQQAMEAEPTTAEAPAVEAALADLEKEEFYQLLNHTQHHL